MSGDPGEQREKWARFRFSIIGPLLAAPPKAGELRAELARLSEKTWRHPTSDADVRFGLSTIERWYYEARRAQDPVGALRARTRRDAGTQTSLGEVLQAALRAQHKAHPRWSYRLHYDNLVALAAQDSKVGPVPSYPTVRRWMKSEGLFRQKRAKRHDTPGGLQAQARLESREVRSYEDPEVNGLWHVDFHQASRKILTRSGQWLAVHLFGALDDKSRLGCHFQWYLAESAENLAHGLSQAIQKRGIPRALMTDRGSAMLAHETREGLAALGINHEPTLAYSPFQNGKMEIAWRQIEGRVLAMLEGVKDLTLQLLNEATLAWLELEYNRKEHSEIGQPPLSVYLAGPDVARPSLSSDDLRRAFRLKAPRIQRRTDGTILVEGVRFEVPSRFRHVERLFVRYARWDLSAVDLVDPRTLKILAPLRPLDKARNAGQERRAFEAPGPAAAAPEPAGIAPLLKKLMADYAATGLPPAYVTKPEEKENLP